MKFVFGQFDSMVVVIVCRMFVLIKRIAVIEML
jgi:hypothetical protein